MHRCARTGVYERCTRDHERRRAFTSASREIFWCAGGAAGDISVGFAASCRQAEQPGTDAGRKGRHCQGIADTRWIGIVSGCAVCPARRRPSPHSGQLLPGYNIYLRFMLFCGGEPLWGHYSTLVRYFRVFRMFGAVHIWGGDSREGNSCRWCLKLFTGFGRGQAQGLPLPAADWRAKGRHKACPYRPLIGEQRAGTRPAHTVR